MQFPLVERELTRTGKKRWTYALRVVPVGIAVLGLAIPTLAVLPGPGGIPLTEFRNMASAVLTRVSLAFQFLCVFVLAPLVSAGLVAQEKRDRTLGLLLMADFRGADIALAKFLSAFTQVEFLLLSTLPLVAFAAYLGGVYLPAAALQLLLLTGLALATCSIGLLCSTITRRPAEALLLTLLIEVAWTLSRFLSGGPAPVAGWTKVVDAILSVDQNAMGPSLWLPPFVFTLTVALMCSAATIVLLPRQVFERPRRAKRTRRRKGVLWREILPASPETRLISASAPGLGIFFWPRPLQYLVALALVPLGLFQCCGVGLFLVMVLVCYDITSSLAAARESGAFDTLLVAPIESPRLARIIIHGFWRRSALFLPCVVAVGLFMLRNALVMPFGGGLGYWLGEGILLIVSGVLVLLAGAALLLTFVEYGCFCSTLSGKPAGQTVAATALFVGMQIAVGIIAVLFFHVVLIVVEVSEMVLDSPVADLWRFPVLVLSMSIGIYAFANMAIATMFHGGFVYRFHGVWRADQGYLPNFQGKPANSRGGGRG